MPATMRLAFDDADTPCRFDAAMLSLIRYAFAPRHAIIDGGVDIFSYATAIIIIIYDDATRLC